MNCTSNSPVLRVDAEAFHRLDTSDTQNLSSIWKALTTCADSVSHGRRLENLFWRMWTQETFCASPRSATASGDATVLCGLQPETKSQREERRIAPDGFDRMLASIIETNDGAATSAWSIPIRKPPPQEPAASLSSYDASCTSPCPSAQSSRSSLSGSMVSTPPAAPHPPSFISTTHDTVLDAESSFFTASDLSPRQSVQPPKPAIPASTGTPSRNVDEITKSAQSPATSNSHSEATSQDENDDDPTMFRRIHMNPAPRSSLITLQLKGDSGQQPRPPVRPRRVPRRGPSIPSLRSDQARPRPTLAPPPQVAMARAISTGTGSSSRAPQQQQHEQPGAALSPRTARHKMLSTELTASLRRHLVRERLSHKSTAVAVLRRRNPHAASHDAPRPAEDGLARCWVQCSVAEGHGQYNSKGW